MSYDNVCEFGPRFLICGDKLVNSAPASAEFTSTNPANPDPAGFRKYKSGTALYG